MADPLGSKAPVPKRDGPDPLIGRVVNDRFRVVSLIARGGMGKVYRAEQAPLGRAVALKVLNPNYSGEHDPEFHKRFFLEASTCSKLTHPNTVTIFDYGRTDDDVYYIAMELLEGKTLHRALREGSPFSADRAMHIARQMCRSLREAHSLGVIHRDLKPANIFLVRHGDENDFVKVLDFGLVKDLAQKGDDLTETGLFMGSPKYMSPEQIRGDRVGPGCDIYSLGVIMYEMLTGKVPFDRPNSVNILMAHVHEELPAFAQINPNADVPPMLERVVKKALAKSASDRFASMDELLLALKEAASEGGLAISHSGETAMSGEYSLPHATSSFPPVQIGDSASMGITPSGPVPVSRSNPPRPAPADGVPTQSSAHPLLTPAPAAPPTAKRIVIAAAILLAAVGAYWSFSQVSDPTLETRGATEDTAAEVGSQVAPAVTPDPVPPVADPATTPPTEPAQADESVVFVSLRSVPTGASVSYGDRRYGPTPVDVEWRHIAQESEVSLRFEREGYRDLTVTRVVHGPRLEVIAHLEPIRRPPVRPRSPGNTEEVRPEGYKENPF